MFAIRHRVDGTYWMTMPARALASGWTTNPEHARRFVSQDDALTTAFLECTADVLDYDAVELPVAEQVSA